MDSLNHKQRYVVDIINDQFHIFDTFANARVATLSYSEKHRGDVVTLCSILNGYWAEIIALREKANGGK